jgi:N-acetyl-anhydromuramyl-L-alanine amidase AmpD
VILAAALISAAVAAPPPAIVERHIPMPAKRKREMRAYSKRHYGKARLKLEPKVIVEHIAVAPTAESVFNTFAPDHPDPELHELPNVCAHYLISEKNTILELVSPRIRCRHTVGLNHVAIGIEHVGYSDGDVLDNRKRLRASLRLTAYLRCTYGIAIRNVIGHSESLSSPYHRERVKRLRTQTHGDWSAQSMRTYRRRLARRACEAAG